MLRRSCALSLLVLALLAPARARATILGDAMLGQMFAEQLKQTLQLSQQLAQLKSSLDVARNNYQLARSVYAGVDEARTFDANRFLQFSATSFLQTEPLLRDSTGFAHDVTAQGLNGAPFDPRGLRHQVDLYADAQRRTETNTERLRPYDTLASLSVSEEIETAVHSPEYRKRTLSARAPSTATEGLIAYDAARTDPRLLALLMHMRAESAETNHLAIDLYAQSLNASPGQAQQLQAQAAALSARELSRLSDQQAKALTQQELAHAQNAADAARNRAETDALWQQVGHGFDSTSIGPRSDLPMPRLSDK